ncbi:MAG: adenylate kinase [Actinomycetaceae bacterium]|nr:adenylate kinase [Actinomycetaceae bacterium]
MSLRLIMVGPPGAGKGTQAVGLCERNEIVQVSTGDLFRAHAKANDELGQLAASYSAKGELVPDEVTNRMVDERLNEDDLVNGFLLDGYPRNVDQVKALDEMLDKRNISIDVVIELVVSDEEVVPRLLERAKIQGRSDDTEDVIRRRLDVYHETTRPIVDVYRERGLLRQVDGVGTVEEVARRIDEVISSL